MTNFKSVVLFLKTISLFIVQRNFGNIRYDYVQKYDILKIEQLRKYEKLKIKMTKAELDAMFLRNCQTFNVTPKILTINLLNVSPHDLQSIKKRLLRSAVNKRNKELRSLKRDLSNYEREFRRVLSSVDKFILDKVVKNNVGKITKTTMKTHEKKLRNLTKNISLPFTSADTVHNLSSKLLTTDELEVSKYGLKHPIQSLQINETDTLTTFALIHRAMTNDLKDKKHSGELKTKMSHLPNSYVNSYKPTKNSLKKYKVLKRLRESKDIVILRPDKGCVTLILDQEEYVKKVYPIINDASKFKKLSSDQTILREVHLQRFLRTLKNKGFFTDEICDKIYPSGSKPASIHCLTKIH